MFKQGSPSTAGDSLGLGDENYRSYHDMMATPFYNRMLANTEHCHMSFITHTECTHKMMNRQASWDCSPGSDD